MAIDEARRHALGEKVREVLGVDDGEALMEMLPPVGWADVATKADIDALRLATKADIDGLRLETQTDFADLRGEVRALRGDLHGEIQGLRGDLHGEIQGLRGDLHGEIQGLRGELHGEIHAAINRLIFWLVPLLLAYGAALVRLG